MFFKTLVHTMLVSLALVAPKALAQDISFGVDLVSSYELKFVTISDQPAIQPWVTVNVTDSCFVNGWMSIGAENAGNEQDLTVGCKTRLGTISLEAYNLPGGSDFEIRVAKWQNKFGDLHLLGQYMQNADGRDGFLATVAHPVYKGNGYAIGAAAHAGSAPFSGKDFVSGDLNIEIPLKGNWSVGGLLRHTEGGPLPGTSAMIKTSWSFK